ncbi:hypothetical protein BFP72_06685 [Reichenbachiella sp. 5M10]|uniref:hypothetical protein n=1 Tax=Reichenbachiella sp. 5M10 TaxID=1889772 RepID=UPI000C1543E5|nr:hypothetical protein [Reichenbachiella sp. 5M10]PIB35104.1 hypothetical protein BFP72_06685 [Reichenbachiella sp. 5M10]
MKKHLLLLMGYCFITFSISAQETKVYLGIGGLYNSFQDTRVSDVQFNKVSGFPELGFSRVSAKDYGYAQVYGYLFNTNHPQYDSVEILTVGYNVRLGYLRKIYPNLYLGGTWDVVDYTSRDNELLGNNSNFYRMASDIFISAKYLYRLNESWDFDFGLDYGVLSFVNSAPSFTANFPQKTVDSGEVSFQEGEVRDPLSLKLMVAKPFWEQFYLRTHIKVNFKKRFGLDYSWCMRTYADHKDYPITDAMHRLTFMFNFVSHQKSIQP